MDQKEINRVQVSLPISWRIGLADTENGLRIAKEMALELFNGVEDAKWTASTDVVNRIKELTTQITKISDKYTMFKVSMTAAEDGIR
jgi:hypothetical protein